MPSQHPDTYIDFGIGDVVGVGVGVFVWVGVGVKQGTVNVLLQKALVEVQSYELILNPLGQLNVVELKLFLFLVVNIVNALRLV